MPVECSKMRCNARVPSISIGRGAPKNKARESNSQGSVDSEGSIGPVPVFQVALAGGLSNVHMQLADPGSGRSMEIDPGTYQSGDTRTLPNDIPFGTSNQSAELPREACIKCHFRRYFCADLEIQHACHHNPVAKS